MMNISDIIFTIFHYLIITHCRLCACKYRMTAEYLVVSVNYGLDSWHEYSRKSVSQSLPKTLCLIFYTAGWLLCRILIFTLRSKQLFLLHNACYGLQHVAYLIYFLHYQGIFIPYSAGLNPLVFESTGPN